MEKKEGRKEGSITGTQGTFGEELPLLGVNEMLSQKINATLAVLAHNFL